MVAGVILDEDLVSVLSALAVDSVPGAFSVHASSATVDNGLYCLPAARFHTTYNGTMCAYHYH